ITQRRTTWVREQQEVETRLRTLRAQYAELRDQRDRLLSLGEDGDCPTCTRPLGTHYRDVLDLLERQMETVEADGAYFRSRQGQLQEMPEELATREARRRTMREQGEAAEDHRAQLEGILDRLERVVREVAERSARRTALQSRREETAGRLIALGPPSADDAALRERHEVCAAAFAQASTRAAGAQATREMAGAALTRARAERAAVEERLARVETLEQERVLHDELHRTYSDLRTDLNYALRPELSEIASRLLSELTDARYTELELDDRYRLVVLEEGVPKPVISGGEEDVANLVLRLAISQMIAERAGQAFSLLILDEIFGSLDAQRRDAVLALLRGLQARFEQVIVISHIDDVRDGLDQVFSVGFDPETGAAVVTTAEGPRLGSLPLAEMVG
ncbi:MAG: SbcC/MukB-like Walker B domain-containing protein, partial [Gemmatimonadota bacterium]